MKNRTDLLNHLATTYNLQRYLEVGVQDPNQNFNRIGCAKKRGVDPCKLGRPINEDALIIHTTSDEYFNIHNEIYPGERYDLIFIDGLHTAEQVKKDFENALGVLSPNGFIVLHDCNPEKEEHTIVPRPKERGHWNGDVYKFAVGINKEYAFTVDIDNGCLVFSRSLGFPADTVTVHYATDNDWASFDRNRKRLLNLITWDEFISTHTHVQQV
jgi:hypothetical protein